MSTCWVSLLPVRHCFYLQCCATTKSVYLWFTYYLYSYPSLMFLYVLQINKSKAVVWGHTKIPGGECHRHGIRDMEKTMGSHLAMVIVNFSGNAGECADKLDVSSVHAQWFSHWKSRADDHDVILWCHKDLSCYWGGNYIRKWARALGLLSGFLELNG